MENKKITHKDIASYIGKGLDTVNGWTQRQPKLLELAKIGMFCKINDLSLEKIEKLMEIQRTIKGE